MNEGFSVYDKASDTLCVISNNVGRSLFFSLQRLFAEKVTLMQISNKLFLFIVRITLRDFDLKSKFVTRCVCR